MDKRIQLFSKTCDFSHAVEEDDRYMLFVRIGQLSELDRFILS